MTEAYKDRLEAGPAENTDMQVPHLMTALLSKSLFFNQPVIEFRAFAKQGPGVLRYPKLSHTLCDTNPERSLGSNHVDFGGITIPLSDTSISSSIETGYIEKATAKLPPST